jgi:pSer/pThr/pTyr-binding forkhead associated (FHA) protein
MEIEQRLGLYQVFLKLYEHHQSLLDEILQLEYTGNKVLSSFATRYVTGVIQDRQAYLVSNLIDGRTQKLLQSQGIWTIGRDRNLALAICDRRLSRHHAVIQYVSNEGFYLVDLDSTNGSFVNKEPVHGRVRLKDGDRIRLSSIAFSFFLCDEAQMLDDVPPDLLAQLNTLQDTALPADSKESQLVISSSDQEKASTTGKEDKDTALFLNCKPDLEQQGGSPATAPLNPAQQSQILDRFFRQQVQKTGRSS